MTGLDLKKESFLCWDYGGGLRGLSPLLMPSKKVCGNIDTKTISIPNKTMGMIRMEVVIGLAPHPNQNYALQPLALLK